MSSSSTADSATSTSSATTSLTQSIEKLDGSMAAGKSNYQAWKFRVIRILKEKGLLTAIEESLDKADSKAVARDNAAFTILTLNVRDSQITHIQDCTMAKDAWEALRIVHQGSGSSGRMVLMQRLWVLRMVEGEDMAEHLNRFRELASQVQSLSPNSKGMEESELVTLLSLSLPESYEPIIMALQSRSEDLTFDTFAGRLLQESARRQVAQVRQPDQGNYNTSGAAFSAQHAMREKSVGGRYGMRRGGMRAGAGFGRSKGEAFSSQGRSAGTPKGRGKCFYCQKDGHWKRDCYKKKADEVKNLQPPVAREDMGLAFTVTTDKGKEQEQEVWIVDSGASQHLVSSRKAFSQETYREIVPRGIEIADRSRMQAVGKGDVTIGQMHLTDVLLVPQLGGNLLSVAQVLDSGYNVGFTSVKCKISGRAVFLEAKREGNLYYLPNPPKHEQAHLGLATNKSLPVSLEAWHRRFGHRTRDQASIDYLSPRVSQFLNKGRGGLAEERELYATCAAGRQHKEAATGTRAKSKELLEIVHSDICGPMQVSTLTGEKYFITFIDEMSGRIAVTLLHRKNQALGAFKAYQVRAEKQARRKIGTLRTDGGGEYSGHNVQAYLVSSGIVHVVSPPYTPTQNGLAE